MKGMRNAGDALTASFFQRYRGAVLWLVLLMIGIVYCYFTARIRGNIFISTNLNDYIYLLDAFVHGRVNVIPHSTFDLSLYQGRWYLYWGPAPVLLLWPFYLIWGTNA